MEPEEEGNGSKRKLSPVMANFFRQGQENEVGKCISTGNEFNLQVISFVDASLKLSF